MWDEYTAAKKEMFMATDTKFSPWIVVKSDDKKRARLNCMRYVLNACDYGNKETDHVEAIEPVLIGKKEDVYEDDDW